MAELATIARPYAEALYQATTSQSSDLDAAVIWLEELAAIAANSQLRQWADNPKVTTAQVQEVIVGIVRSELPDLARNFLHTVLDNGRMVALPEIATQFRTLVNHSKGAFDAIVYSAFPLEPAALVELGVTLEARFGRKLHLTVQQDASLIGGVRVVVGDEVLDTSVKARLEQMKVALTA